VTAAFLQGFGHGLLRIYEVLQPRQNACPPIASQYGVGANCRDTGESAERQPLRPEKPGQAGHSLKALELFVSGTICP